MQYFNNKLAVEVKWMIDHNIFSLSNYKWLLRSKKIDRLQLGGNGRMALVDYESLPERFKERIKCIVGNPYECALTNPLKGYLVESSEAFSFFDTYKVNGGSKFLPQKKQREYYSNAVVLNSIQSYISDRLSKHHKFTKSSLMIQVSKYVQELSSSEWPHSLPCNVRSLERKLKNYQHEGYLSLIHKNYLAQISNAAKIKSKEQESILIMLLSDPRNLSDAHVCRGYNTIAHAMSWECISVSSVAVWREKKHDIIYARKHGVKDYNNKMAMQHKRRSPQFPLYMWTLDGWDVELLYQKREKGRITYHNRPTIVVVLDTCLKYPIGYSIGTHETPDLIIEALRNAAFHTEELFGTMYKTQQLQFDNYQKKKLMPKYLPITNKVVPAKVGNAKSKIIERWFAYFNEKYCRVERNTSGIGITAKKSKQPNIDFLQKEKKHFPNYEEICNQIDSFMAAERKELHEAYLQKFNSMPSKHKCELSLSDYLFHYGKMTGRRNLLQGNGIQCTIDSKIINYDCFDINFRSYPSIRWEIRYDANNISRALACNENHSLKFLLEEKYEQPMALIERKEQDIKQLDRINNFNHRHSTKLAKELGECQDISEQLLDLNQLKGEKTLSKLLITDSNGQHKDRRNKVDHRTSNLSPKKVVPNCIYDKY